jgi:hypothetical protein
MAFSDRMKELFDQGVAASKEFASQIGEKAQDWGEKGYKASKDFVSKAGAKAQDLGERGVLMVEIRQLEGQAQRLINSLGTEIYHAFVEKGAKSVTVSTPEVKKILSEIAVIKDSIEKKDAELKNR